MAHVTEFTVEGLAGRSDVVSEKLDRHINVFFGQNGSGKTSLLKILHSAMRGDGSILSNVPFTRAQVKIYSVTHDKVYTRNCMREPEAPKAAGDESPTLAAVIEAASTVADQQSEESKIKWDDHPPHPKGVTSWHHRYLPTSRLYLSDTAAAKVGYLGRTVTLSEDLLEESFANLVKRIWSSYSAEVLGTIQRAQAAGLAEILKAILSGPQRSKQSEQLDPLTAYERVSRFLERQGSKNILGSLESFREDYVENAQLRSVVSDINKVEVKIQEAVAPRDKLEAVIQQMYSGNKHVTFTDTDIEVTGAKDVKIGLARLSSGEKQLMRILLDTLLADLSSLILDEPEISMHVDWQRSLLGTMRQLNGRAQLIIATHSPEIMAEVEESRIFRL